MEIKKEYKNQMISVDISIFSVIENKLNVLLVQRNEEPYKTYFSLVGGKVYNNESCEQAVAREVYEKIGVKNITPYLSGVFSDPNRDIRFRNISISYYCLVNHNEFISKLNKTKVIDAKWTLINEIPQLAFDHNEILQKSLSNLRNQVFEIDFIKNYLPENFTLVELQKIYESILNHTLDKRNFRRKLTSLNCLENTGKKNLSDVHKKSEIYKFKNKK